MPRWAGRCHPFAGRTEQLKHAQKLLSLDENLIDVPFRNGIH